MQSSVFVGVRLSKSQIEKLEKLEMKTKKSRSEIIRSFIDKGLAVDSYEADEQRMLLAIRKAVEMELERPVERLAAIGAKGTHTSAAAFFAMLEVLKLLVDDDDADTVPRIAQKARRLGIEYLKEKIETVDEFLDKRA